MLKKAICFGLASAALCSASHAGVKYIGTSGGTASSIVDLSVPSVDGVVYTEATFEAAFGGDYTDAASAVNGVPTWQLTAADEYVLEDIVAIANGNLIIDAGVVVRGQPRSAAGVFDGGSLLISSSAKIIAAGESTNPIVFTTASTTGGATGGRASGGTPSFWDVTGGAQSPETAGLWGGLLILGKAPTNVDRDAGAAANVATREQRIVGYGTGANRDTFSGTMKDGTTTYTNVVVAANADDRSQIEGIPGGASIVAAGLDRFGGFDADDNSGILKYASIRHGGANVATNAEVNGLTLGAVGRGTTISYVEIYGNTDDGIEIFGGTVNPDHIVVIAQQDDGIDLDAGYSGRIQFALVVAGSNSDKLLEWDGSYEGETVNGFAISSPAVVSGTQVANYALYNATLVANATGSQSGNNGIHIRDQSAARVVNSIIYQARSNGVEVDNRVTGNRSTTNNFATGLAEFKGVTLFGSFANTAAGWVNAGSDDATVEAALSAASQGNLFDANPGLGAAPAVALSSTTLFDMVPDSGAAGAGALDAVFDDSVFSANADITFVPYRGAFDIDTTELWTSGWTAAAQYGVIIP